MRNYLQSTAYSLRSALPRLPFSAQPKKGTIDFASPLSHNTAMSTSNRHILPSWVINLFFALGLLSSTAIRLLIIFDHVAREFVRPAWYVGVSGYVIFFAYRYAITRRRRRLIEQHDLVAKVKSGTELSTDEREALEYVLLSVSKSRENLNYLVIFAFSFMAIAADIILTLTGK